MNLATLIWGYYQIVNIGVSLSCLFLTELMMKKFHHRIVLEIVTEIDLVNVVNDLLLSHNKVTYLY